ncbi:MAG: hypothetical protein H8E21_02995 [Gammaproteobacteria bacterium]|nr:hypothetical protein [Gammaproteobacteria bacterium]
MKKMLIIISLLLIQGCTHTLYQSDIMSKNNLDQEQAYRLWWIKTSVFSSDKGSGSMKLDMGCSRKDLTDSGEEIVMILPADQYTSTSGQSGPKLNCAKVTNLDQIKNYKQGEIAIVSSCEPKQDDFSLSPITFLRANTTHHFPVTKTDIEDTSYSPQPLPCQ